MTSASLKKRIANDCEEEDVEGYLSRANSGFVYVEESEESVEEEELVFEATVPDDGSSSSDESLNQPSGKFTLKLGKNYIKCVLVGL